jgi:hypothetical protein
MKTEKEKTNLYKTLIQKIEKLRGLTTMKSIRREARKLETTIAICACMSLNVP